MNRLIAFALAASLLVLASCSKPEPEPAALSEPDAPVVVAPAPVPAPGPANGEPDLASNDATVINLEGFGPAKFGADEEQVRMAWGHPLDGKPGMPGSTCYFLFPDPPKPGASGIAFMMEEGAFVRYDVDTAAFAAPGNLAVGMQADAVMAAFPGQIEATPHKYVEGQRYLTYTPADGSQVRLVFEVDDRGKIVRWRIGRLPQVQYVEGCG